MKNLYVFKGCETKELIVEFLNKGNENLKAYPSIYKKRETNTRNEYVI